jgi:HD-GYP domain-containing protein (c-di-GMP phosphodiesterase class II)
MRFIRISDLEAGMIVARSIYGAKGVLILRGGRTLEYKQIGALAELGYPGIYVNDFMSLGVEPQEIVEERTRHSAIEMVKSICTSGNKNSERTQLLYRDMTNLISDIVDSIFESDATTVNVPLLKFYDEYTYRHSVDVGVLSIAIGKAMGLNHKRLHDLGKAAFFHDLGKMLVPQAILNKPGKLTDKEFDVMKQHSNLGRDFVYEILMQKSDIYNSVLHHHERFDGRGYPYGIKGHKIPLFARIIAVADVFDAISSTRSYKMARIATEGYEYVMANAGLHFDPEIVEVFCKTIAPFPVGMTVKLSNGLHAVVVRNNTNFMSRPLIRAFKAENPMCYDYIDLSSGRDVQNITIIGN